jgi:hypothetical protein
MRSFNNRKAIETDSKIFVYDRSSATITSTKRRALITVVLVITIRIGSSFVFCELMIIRFINAWNCS